MTKRLICTGYMLLFAVCTAWANSPLEVSQDLWDVGEIWEGQLVTLNIPIRNKSENTITLGEIKGGCYCVATEVSAKTILPGKQADLAIKLLRNKPGKFSESVIIQGYSEPKESDSFQQRIAVEGDTKPTYSIRGMWQDADPQAKPSDTMVAFTRSESCTLPMWPFSQPSQLIVHLSGVRPDDPVAQTDSVAVDSAYFKLVDHTHQSQTEGKLDCTLALEPKNKLGQGLFFDRLTVKLGSDLKLTRNLSFRLIGPVWSDKPTVNFGRVRANDPAARKVLLHFPSTETVWPHIVVIKTEPSSYASAVNIAQVEAKGKVVEVTLAPDPLGLSKVDGFFNFHLYLGPKAAPSQEDALQENSTVKLSVYGMAIR